MQYVHSLLIATSATMDVITTVVARECRRKKKEYIKCLENRVAVLETQNRALIKEFKSLKDLYCYNAEQ